MMDIFDYSLKKQLNEQAPLADRMRPLTLDEFVGQSHILAPGRLLRRAIQADQLSSLIFYGPPGTGKTTLAKIIANTTKAQFISLNAVLSGVKNIRESISSAEKYRKEYEKRTILFIDEVHRFNKSQQDALLPHVENGTVILIGATTENPYFEVNKALVSRSRIFQLQSLTNDDLESVLEFALKNEERGFGSKKIDIAQEARHHLTKTANGDARALLNALELAVITSTPNEKGNIEISLEVAEESIQKKAVLYDKDGDAHFDIISAFIKSLRGSDPDAALYWMAKMVYGGEDPRFLFRRMIIFASEDIGMADPNALNVVVSAAQAYDYVGMPEGRFPLSHACIYLATAPKSNSTMAFFDALDSVAKEQQGDVPNHLKDGNRDGEGFGHGKGYMYPHAYENHWVAQQYLPDVLQGRVFYQPNNQGFESEIREKVIQKREAFLASFIHEANTVSGTIDEYWQSRTFSNTSQLYTDIRNHLFERIEVKRDAMALVLNAGEGLLLGEMLRKTPEGTVYGLVRNESEKSILDSQYSDYEYLSRPIIEAYNPDYSNESDLKSIFENEIRFDLIIGKNPLFVPKRRKTWIEQLTNILILGGEIGFVESVGRKSQRISEYLSEKLLPKDLYSKVKQAEDEIFQSQDQNGKSAVSLDFAKELENSGFRLLFNQNTDFYNKTTISRSKIEEWFTPGNRDKINYVDHLEETLSGEEIDLFKNLLMKTIVGKVVKWRSCWLFVKAIYQP